MDGEVFTIPGVYPAVKAGDTFTMSGAKVRTLNPDRRWWQFWRSRWVETDELQTFRVIEVTQDGQEFNRSQ